MLKTLHNVSCLIWGLVIDNSSSTTQNKKPQTIPCTIQQNHHRSGGSVVEHRPSEGEVVN